MRYTVTDQGPRTTGFCHTIDLSSTHLNFTADRPLLVGQRLEVSINWPALLDGGVQLQLILTGLIVRTNQSTTTLQIQRHEFRTRRLGPIPMPPPEKQE